MCWTQRAYIKPPTTSNSNKHLPNSEREVNNEVVSESLVLKLAEAGVETFASKEQLAEFHESRQKIPMLLLVSRGSFPKITELAERLLYGNNGCYTFQECFNVSFSQTNKCVYSINRISSFIYHYQVTVKITVTINQNRYQNALILKINSLHLKQLTSLSKISKFQK